MNELMVGGYVKSTAGHDFGQYYVILSMEGEYAYLVDGKIRTLDRPKKKKLKHLAMLPEKNEELREKILCQSVINEEIKRAVKLLKHLKSEKEV